ncbi:hypothetical protein FRC17_010129 [Serendipita sp. 399]|nr:hypothetical protein FRC17_010129 [Serendipita sp. 399]
MDARFSQSLGFLASPSKKSGRPATRMGNHPSAQPVDVHQSLILVEEADIMFQSDVNFWPTLVSFIRSSRRPVIITCNGLIPIEDLPLQAILEFQECSNELAVSYLQAIGIHEGHYIKRETAYNYYTHDAMYHPLDADIPDQPMHPLPSQGRLVIPDLKRSINALQFFLTTDNTISVPYETNVAAFGNWSDRPAVMPEIVNGTEDGLFRKPAPQEDLETLIHLSELADSISFGDAFIDRRLKDSLREGSIDRYRPSSDDTQGYTLLCKVEEPEEAVFTSALRPREDDMALWVAYHARLRLEQRGHGQIARRYLGSPLALTTSPKGSKGPPTPASSFNSTELAIRRAKYQKRIVYALDELMTAKSSLLPSPGCILDYVPWMREMARGMSAEWRGMSLEGSRLGRFPWNGFLGGTLFSDKKARVHKATHFDLVIYPKHHFLKKFARTMRKDGEIKVARRFSPLPSLAALAFSNPSPTVFTADAASLTQGPHHAFSSFKPQLPALSVNPVSRPAPSGRPGSPFSFGNPPEYPRASSTYNQSAERDYVPENMDLEQQDQQSRGPPSSYQAQRLPLEQDSTGGDQYPDGFDYTMRRHSIATLQSSNPNHVLSDPRGPGQRSPFHPTLESMKRKISHGSMIYGGHTPVESEFQDTYRSPMDPEPPKGRRGSAFDTRGIAQMSLNERRESFDSRFAPANWWERRDSTTSLYSNTSVSSVGGYASSFSGDSKQWPPQRTPQPHIPDTLPPNARVFPSLPDPRTPTATTHGPSTLYDTRRMSVPDASIASGAIRNLRSRSRPPSRGAGSSQTVTPPHLPQITATLVNNEHYQDPNIALSQQQTPVSAGSTSGMLNLPKESSTTTPYSRSPELRISHKLAERKRRKEMKDLFDELRDNLPADRGMKSSKWEILTKAIEYIAQIRTQQQDLLREIDTLKAEIDVLRGGAVPPTNGHHYGGSMAYQQASYNPTNAQTRTSSHYPAAGPVPPPI